MKLTLTALATLLTSSITYADFTTMLNFQADFTQIIQDDHNKTITYKGDVIATQPAYALWKYKSPVTKSVYVLRNKVVMVEPELEQAIIKTMQSSFDFFTLLKSAKKVSKNHYEAIFENVKYTILTKGNIVKTIQYEDEFENKITIEFTHQQVNQRIDLNVFNPYIPQGFDIIRD